MDFFSDIYQNPLTITWFDEVVQTSETQKVMNGKIVLSYIPDQFQKVSIPGYTEIPIGFPTENNQYVVNYTSGIISFYQNVANGTSVNLSYFARGIIQYSSDRIRVQDADNLLESDNVEDALKENVAKANSLQAQIDALVVEGDSSAEAAQARVGQDGTVYNTLKARIDSENSRTMSNISTLDAKVNSQASGSPKGTYATLSNLQSAFPTGNTNIYLVTADGKWYYWNDTAWTAGGTYQSTGIETGAVTRKKLNNDVTNFIGERAIVTTGSPASDYNVALRFVYDVRDIDITNLPIEFSFDFYTRDTNLKNMQIRIFGSADVSSSGSAIGSYSTTTTVSLDEVKSYTHTVTPTVNYNFIHAFIYPTLNNPNETGEYFYKNVLLKLNSQVRSLLSRRRYNGGFEISSVKQLPNQLIPKDEYDAIESNLVKSEKTGYYNGFRVLAKSNPINKIQMGIAFDLTSIKSQIILNEDIFTISGTIESESTKIKDISTQFRLNGTSKPGSLGGTSISSRGVVKYKAPRCNYTLTDVLTAAQDYLHVFFDISLTEALTEPIEVFANNFKLVIKDQVLSKVPGMNLFDKNADDIVEYVEETKSNIVTREKLNRDLLPFNGYKINAIANTSSTTMIQLGLVWDISSLLPGIVVNTSKMELRATIKEPYSKKLHRIKTQYRFNSSSSPTNTGGTSISATSQPYTSMKDLETKISYTNVITDNTQPYLHAWIDLHGFEAITTPTDIFINDIKMFVDGVELPKEIASGLYAQNPTDILESMNYKEDQLVKYSQVRGANSPLNGAKINIIGDSITVSKSFTSKFYHDFIREKYGIGLVRNYGISGSTIANKVSTGRTDYFTNRYQSMDNDADYVLVFGGTNDSSGGSSAVPIGVMSDRSDLTFYGACHILLNGLIEKYPTKKIGVLLPLQRSSHSTLPYVDALREVCEYYSIPYLDLFRKGGITPANTTHMNLVMPDGLHPNEKGHELLSNKIGSFLNSI